MIRKVAMYMKRHQMISEGMHICAGVSGGADSVCLFLILKRLQATMGFSMSVVHIEHGIRGDASLSDMEFVKRLAEEYNVEFSAYAYPVRKIAKEQGLSIEEAGRLVRYEAFERECAKYKTNVRTALAHHADDSAETTLFHLCRGSGIEGLRGIRPLRGNVIRPLLCVTRKEIEAFLEKEGQPYRQDATNADVRYSRNRIRNRIMPELTRINRQFADHLNQLSEDAAEISEYLSGEVNKILKSHLSCEADGCLRLDLTGFFEYPPILQKRSMLEALAMAGGGKKDIGREHVRSLLRLSAGQTGKRISLPCGATGEKTYGALLLYPENVAKKKESLRVFVPLTSIPGKVKVPAGTLTCHLMEYSKKDLKIPENVYTKWFDYDKIKDRLYFRTREPGDYFVLDKAGHRKKLKDHWIDEKVPGCKRGNILLLAEGSHILWAVGGRISAAYKVTGETKTILEVRFMEEKHE